MAWINSEFRNAQLFVADLVLLASAALPFNAVEAYERSVSVKDVFVYKHGIVNVLRSGRRE